jgi:hypothetical protein
VPEGFFVSFISEQSFESVAYGLAIVWREFVHIDSFTF